MHSLGRDTKRLLAAGANLVLASTTAEVADALFFERIEAVLLRGSTLTEWLYGDASARTSLDVDLLISPGRLADAERCLRKIGFAPGVDLTPGTRPEHANTWRRRATSPVDLHWSLVGVTVNPDRVWRVIRGSSHPSAEFAHLCVPTPALRPLLVALHAGQHGAAHRRTVGDLERALDITDYGCWSRALGFAEQLKAVEMFGYGLRISPKGAQLADQLGISRSVAPRTALRTDAGRTPTATGFAWLHEGRGWRDRLHLVSHKVLPPADFMRDWLPLARTGRVGLGLAYAYRLFWLARWAPAGYAAWRRARKTAVASQRDAQ
jgi:hypothetical protein